MAEGIADVIERLDRLERSLEPITHFAAKLPTLGDLLGDSASFAMREAERRNLDPILRGPEWLDLAGKAMAPDQVARLGRLLERADIVDRLLEATPALEALLARRERLVGLLSLLDAMDDADLRTLSTEGARAARILRRPAVAAALEAADRGGLDVAAQAGVALAATPPSEAAPMGFFATLRALGEPDIARAVGWTLAVARRFGAMLGR